MSVVLCTETPTTTATGTGWVATIAPWFMYVHVNPAGDPLPAALAELIGPARLRYWTVEWSHEDEFGCDVYYVAAPAERAQLTVV